MTEIDFFDIVQGQIAAFLLVLTRTSGIFFISPFFGSLNIPVQIRAAVAIVMAVVTFPVIVKQTVVTAPDTLLMFAGTIAQELFIGWLIGFIAYVAFAAINMSVFPLQTSWIRLPVSSLRLSEVFFIIWL